MLWQAIARSGGDLANLNCILSEEEGIVLFSKLNVMDMCGDHGTMCSYSNENPKRRHDSIKTLLANMGKTAGLITKIEQNPTTAITSNIKPADVLFENYQQGQSLAIDVTCVSPFRCNVQSRAARQFLFLQKIN